jgi:hypothetical protein
MRDPRGATSERIARARGVLPFGCGTLTHVLHSHGRKIDYSILPYSTGLSQGENEGSKLAVEC